jgi:hypothetical protein
MLRFVPFWDCFGTGSVFPLLLSVGAGPTTPRHGRMGTVSNLLLSLDWKVEDPRALKLLLSTLRQEGSDSHTVAWALRALGMLNALVRPYSTLPTVATALWDTLRRFRDSVDVQTWAMFAISQLTPKVRQECPLMR